MTRFGFQHDEALQPKRLNPDLYDGGFSFEDEQAMLRGWCFKKGGGSTTSKSYTSSLPEYARPYYENMMNQAQAVAREPYQAYQGDRIAGFTPDTEASFQGVRDVNAYGDPAGMAAQQYASMGTAKALGTGYDPNAVQSNYQQSYYAPNQFYAPAVQGMTVDPSSMYARDPNAGGFQQMQQPGDVNTRIFNSGVRDFYMSPYQEAVTDRLKQQAQLDYDRQGSARDTAAVNAGAFGGSRQAVADYLAEEGLHDRLSDIDAQGRQSAFENAQMQFERDRASRLQADLANQGMAYQTGAQNLGAAMQGLGLGLQSDQANLNAYLQAMQGNQGTGLQAALANQGALMDVQRMGEQSRQFGANLGEQSAQFGANLDYQSQLANEQNRQAAAGIDLQSAQTGLQGAGQLGTLGSQFQSDWLQRLQSLAGVGTEYQQQHQQALDTAYSDFINQRDYPRQNLTWLSSILQGVPISANTNVTQTSPGPNPYSQALGMGLGAAGIYNTFGGG